MRKKIVFGIIFIYVFCIYISVCNGTSVNVTTGKWTFNNKCAVNTFNKTITENNISNINYISQNIDFQINNSQYILNVTSTGKVLWNLTSLSRGTDLYYDFDGLTTSTIQNYLKASEKPNVIKMIANKTYEKFNGNEYRFIFQSYQETQKNAWSITNTPRIINSAGRNVTNVKLPEELQWANKTVSNSFNYEKIGYNLQVQKIASFDTNGLREIGITNEFLGLAFYDDTNGNGIPDVKSNKAKIELSEYRFIFIPTSVADFTYITPTSINSTQLKIGFGVREYSGIIFNATKNGLWGYAIGENIIGQNVTFNCFNVTFTINIEKEFPTIKQDITIGQCSIGGLGAMSYISYLNIENSLIANNVSTFVPIFPDLTTSNLKDVQNSDQLQEIESKHNYAPYIKYKWSEDAYQLGNNAPKILNGVIIPKEHFEMNWGSGHSNNESVTKYLVAFNIPDYNGQILLIDPTYEFVDENEYWTMIGIIVVVIIASVGLTAIGIFIRKRPKNQQDCAGSFLNKRNPQRMEKCMAKFEGKEQQPNPFEQFANPQN